MAGRQYEPVSVSTLILSPSNIVQHADFAVSSSSGTAFLRANASGESLAAAIADGDYLEFFITPAAGKKISLVSFVFDHKASNSTATPFESSFAVFASTNGFATPPVAGEALGISTAAVDADIGGDATVLAGNVIVSLESFGVITDADTLHFRIYGYDDGDLSEQIGRVDNVRIAAMGTIESVTTTPVFSASDQTNDVFLTSFTVGGIIYRNLTSATGVKGSVNSGREFLWGASEDATDPGAEGVPFADAFASAVTDLNLTTGSLNGGDGTIYEFETAGGNPLGINSNDLFFVFYNGAIDTPWSIVAVNTSGNSITAGLKVDVSTSSLKRFDFLRSGAVAAYPPASWTALPNRSVSGVAFKASDFAFTGGNTVGDIAGIRFINSSRFDVQDIGVTTVIPPPSGTIIFLN